MLPGPMWGAPCPVPGANAHESPLPQPSTARAPTGGWSPRGGACTHTVGPGGEGGSLPVWGSGLWFSQDAFRSPSWSWIWSQAVPTGFSPAPSSPAPSFGPPLGQPAGGRWPRGLGAVLWAGPATYQLLRLLPMKLRFLSLETKLGGGDKTLSRRESRFLSSSWVSVAPIPSPQTHLSSPDGLFPSPPSPQISGPKTCLLSKPVTKGDD